MVMNYVYNQNKNITCTFYLIIFQFLGDLQVDSIHVMSKEKNYRLLINTKEMSCILKHAYRCFHGGISTVNEGKYAYFRELEIP